MRIRIRTLEALALYAFLFLFLFANLGARITGVNLSVLFYLTLPPLLLLAARVVQPDPLIVANLVTVGLFTIYVLDPRSSLVANAWSIRDFVVPMLGFPIGYLLRHHERWLINYLNLVYLPFVAYGIVQAILFYAGRLDAVLPWDARWVEELSAVGVHNTFQGDVLRFFGTMNSFVEYQVSIAILLAFLWFSRGLIRRRSLFVVNFLLGLTFLALALERSPVAMLGIVVGVWKTGAIAEDALRLLQHASLTRRQLQGILAAGLTVPVFAVGLYAIVELVVVDTNRISAAYERLMNMVTLNFGDDPAVRERIDYNWPDSLELASSNLLGVGPGLVTPSASLQPGAVGPHNNFLAYYLAYGVIGLAAVAVFFTALFVRLWTREGQARYFGGGLFLSYSTMAIFNIPFAGKMGILFFLIAGFLVSRGRCAVKPGEEDVRAMVIRKVPAPADALYRDA